MNDFTLVKHGYDPNEVQNYIIRLKANYEAKLSEQKDRIFYLKDQLDTFTSASENELITSLARAVERAKQIENSSHNIFELETKRLKLLYSRMESDINEVKDMTTLNNLKAKLLKHIQECNAGLDKNVEMMSKSISLIDGEDPVRRLLQKITNKNRVVNIGNIDNFIQQMQPQEAAVKKQPKQEIHIAPKPQGVMYKTEVVPTIGPKKENNTFKNFLNDDNNKSATFENIMFKNNKKKSNSVITAELSYPTPNESGFDLKAAVNPKDDLSEIMKAFDFYSEEPQKSKKKK